MQKNSKTCKFEKSAPNTKPKEARSKEKKTECDCKKNITIHTFAAPEEKICGSKKRKNCKCPVNLIPEPLK